ncbi:hypothetical protein JN11_04791 [Mucilaginibacter frigoritolerans]|uniref:Lipocalin-like protein n=1 Tax=Mucilaginibacter frigoritolerans TaxID=652788 RepID=A0A562TKV7_9SPHI|nr:hypothetical protein [Mucilaginibacter frigoritolerans]TWI94185.1 hypothetical protein JN11_04791 [Mucilaginibacter frigoritolerans]
MKIKYILLAIAAVAFCLPACKKDKKTPVISNATLLGKWDEVKFHLTENNINGTVTDTTITAASLSANDYAQFNSDYTVNIFQSANNATQGSASPDYISESIYSYTISGSTAILAPEAILLNINTPAGSITWVVTMIDANNIDLRYTDSAGAIKVVSDTYYTRAQ